MIRDGMEVQIKGFFRGWQESLGHAMPGLHQRAQVRRINASAVLGEGRFFWASH